MLWNPVWPSLRPLSSVSVKRTTLTETCALRPSTGCAATHPPHNQLCLSSKPATTHHKVSRAQPWCGGGAGPPAAALLLGMSRGCLRVISYTDRLLRYGPSLELQERLAAELKAGTGHNTLLIVQHHPVFTVGKRGSPRDFHTDLQELAGRGIDVVSVPRGGETTYHGPGQLVAYPILNLRQLGLGARAFVEGLEDAMVHTVGCFGVQARGRVQGKTGVWVGERKIGAVGVRISHGISSHGIALNVATDLSAYQHIVPCGTPDKEVTSLLRELTMQRQRPRAGASSGGGVGPAQLQQPPLTWHTQHHTSSAGSLTAAAETCLVSCLTRVLGLQPAAVAPAGW